MMQRIQKSYYSKTTTTTTTTTKQQPRNSSSHHHRTHAASPPIIFPHDNDILLGRGGNNNQHKGNQQLRELARAYSYSYKMSSKTEKADMARELVHQMRLRNPPGRFLKRKSTDGVWEEMNDECAKEKAFQVLRDAVAGIKSHTKDTSTSSTASTTSTIVSYNNNYNPVPAPAPAPAPMPIQQIRTPFVSNATSQERLFRNMRRKAAATPQRQRIAVPPKPLKQQQQQQQPMKGMAPPPPLPKMLHQQYPTTTTTNNTNNHRVMSSSAMPSKRTSPLSKRLKKPIPPQPDPFLQESAPVQRHYHSPGREGTYVDDDVEPLSPLSFSGLGELSPLAISPIGNTQRKVVDFEMDLMNCELMTSDDDPIMTSDDDEMSC